MSMFKRRSQIIAGTSKKDSEKRKKLFEQISSAWNQFDAKDQRIVYTWGAMILVVIVVMFLVIPLFHTAPTAVDFSEYDTHAYDLADMPFTSDEAEEYLVSAKYPELQEARREGIYSQEQKTERQAADQEAAARQKEYMQQQAAAQQQASSDKLNPQVEGYQVASNGGATPTGTPIEKLASASFKTASGKGITGVFGASSGAINSKNQQNKDEGTDATSDDEHGINDAKEALFRMSRDSRAAAGLGGDKETNARKALVGGGVTGNKAFMADSAGVELDSLSGHGLDLDPELLAGADAGELDKRIQKAIHKSKDEKEKEETEWEKWMATFREIISNGISALVTGGLDLLWEECREYIDCGFEITE